jgi:hypothetical protein
MTFPISTEFIRVDGIVKASRIAHGCRAEIFVTQIFNLSVSVGIVAHRANFLVLVVVLVLVIETKAIEDENEDEEEFGCGCAALRRIAELHSAGHRNTGARVVCLPFADCKSAIQQDAILRYEPKNAVVRPRVLGFQISGLLNGR